MFRVATISILLTVLLAPVGIQVLCVQPQDIGNTYIFKGGEWGAIDSWDPRLPQAGGPSPSDNAIIPEGTNAAMPKVCDVGTLTISGKVTMGDELLVNSMTIESKGEFMTGTNLRCNGMVKNLGRVSGKTFKGTIQNLDNSGSIDIAGKINIVVMFKLTNTSNIKSIGLMMLRSGLLVNTGTIKAIGTPGNIALFVNREMINDGKVDAASGYTDNAFRGTNGGNVWVACSRVAGIGSIIPGSGGDGNPPGKKGQTLIGEIFDQNEWNTETMKAPKGNPPSDLTAWIGQLGKGNPKDGKMLGSSGTLSLSTPPGARPGYYSKTLTYIGNVAGTTITSTLAWNGQGIVYVEGRCNQPSAKVNLIATYLRPGEKTGINITFPYTPEGLKTLVLTFRVPETNYQTSLEIDIYFVKCPIIEGKVGQKTCKIADDKGVSRNAMMVVAPTMKNGVLVVPLRFFVESCGGKVVWDSKTHSATVTIPGRVVTFSKSSNYASVNGYKENLSSSSFIQSNRMMVDAKSLADFIGASFKLDSSGYTFTYPAQP